MRSGTAKTTQGSVELRRKSRRDFISRSCRLRAEARAFLGKHPYFCCAQQSLDSISISINSLRSGAEIALVDFSRWHDPNRAEVPQQVQGLVGGRHCLELMPTLQPAHVDGWLAVIITKRQVAEISHSGNILSNSYTLTSRFTAHYNSSLRGSGQ